MDAFPHVAAAAGPAFRKGTSMAAKPLGRQDPAPLSPRVPDDLRKAYKTLCEQIPAAKANWSMTIQEFRNTADDFVRCLFGTLGGRQELECRALRIRDLTAEGSQYASSKLLAFDTCRVLMLDRQSTKIWAVERGLEIEFSNALQWKGSASLSKDVVIEVRNTENLLKDLGSVIELTDYERECRNVIHAGKKVAADGCYLLWHLHCAIAGEGSKESQEESQRIRTLLESDLGTVWLDEISAAADSLMAWAEERADTARASSIAATWRNEQDALKDSCERSTRKQPGPKKADYKTMQREAQIVDEWKRKHQRGAHKAQFARTKGMKPVDFEKLLNRVRQRRSRAKSDSDN